MAATAVVGAPALASAPAGAVGLADAVTVDVGQDPSVIGIDPVTHTAYVVNSGNGQAQNGNGGLSIVTGTEVTTRRVGGTPVDVAVDVSTHTAYVPVYNTESSLLVVAPHRRTRLPLSNPQAVAVDSSTHTVWVLEAPRLLVKIVGTTQTTYNVKGAFPMDVAVNPVTHVPYVLSVDGTLSEVVLSTGTVVVQQLSPSARAIAFDSTTGTTYVAHSGYFDAGVSHPALLSVLSGLYLRVVDIGPYSVGGLDVDETTHTAAVSLYSINNRAFGELALVRNGHARYETVGGTPGAVAADAQDGATCVANEWSSDVSIVQAGVVQTVPAGDSPTATVTDDGANLCYVANFLSHTVTEVPLP